MFGCEALGAYVGALGPLLGPMLAVLGPMLAVLGRSWGLCRRSWERIRAQVGGLEAQVVGLGSDKGEKWPKPEPESDLASGSRPKSGPNPSRKAVLGRELKSSASTIFLGAGSFCRFFL